MSDTANNPDTAGQNAQDTAQGGQQGQSGQQAQEQGPVPYARFAEVNRSYQELKTKMDKIEADQRTAAEQKLKDDGKLQELLAARERELAEERSTRLRLGVAAKKGLVGELAPLAERLRGATEAELEADADALLALAKKPGGHGVPPAGSGGGRPPVLDLKNMTPAQIREARSKGKL